MNTIYFSLSLKWQNTGDAVYPLRTEHESIEYWIRINDFPEEKLYTLMIGKSEEVISFNDWPPLWIRPNR